MTEPYGDAAGAGEAPNAGPPVDAPFVDGEPRNITEAIAMANGADHDAFTRIAGGTATVNVGGGATEVKAIGGFDGDAEKDYMKRDPEEDTTGAGRGALSAVFNITSSALGAGALALPYAFAYLGLAPAIFMLLISAAMCAYTIYLLLRVAELMGTRTYSQLGHKFFGIWGRRTVAATIVSLTWGLCAVYCAVTSQLLTPFVDELAQVSAFPGGTWGARLFTCMLFVLIMLPASLLKDVGSLTYLSSGAIVAVMVLFIALVARAADTPSSEIDHHVVAFAEPRIEVIQAMTNIKVGFTGHTVAFAVFNGLKRRRVSYMMMAVNIAMGICSLVYASVGISGMLAFGTDAPENILNAFANPLGTWYSAMAYGAMLVVVVVSFPLMMFPTRDATLSLFGFESALTVSVPVRFGVVIGLALSALVVGLFVPSLNLLFGVIGGLSGNLISNVFPALAALCSGEWTVQKVGWIHRICAIVPLIYGVTLGPLGLAVSLYLSFRPEA